jgi:hypothetical protein
MSNILDAIYNIALAPTDAIDKSDITGRNRANIMGEMLENFIKDAFANCIGIQDKQEKVIMHNAVFSWLGVQNNPPDMMIKGGDAIEVKKIEGPSSALHLNSSYPKSVLKSSSPLITKDTRTCEEWDVKDIIYCVGHVSKTAIQSIWMVYGSIYAAKDEVYDAIRNKIVQGVKEIPGIELAVTNELGGIKKVDPLGITDLRIRGMWQIQNPKRVFDYVYETNTQQFELVAIIPKDKYLSMPKNSIEALNKLPKNNITISNVKVKNPNNPAQLIDCVLIVVTRA